MDSSKLSCSKCHEFFEYDELHHVQTKLCGVTVESKVCPYCGSEGWTAVRDEGWFSKYYTDKKILKRYYE